VRHTHNSLVNVLAFFFFVFVYIPKTLTLVTKTWSTTDHEPACVGINTVENGIGAKDSFVVCSVGTTCEG
jgi:hypothetical protein